MKILQGIAAVVVLVVLVNMIFSGSDDEPSASTGDKWYVGGTLHEASVRRWNAATYRNQLATAGDWTTGVLGASEVRKMGISALKVKAAQLVTCINASTRDLDEIGGMSAMEIGAACIVLLKWRT